MLRAIIVFAVVVVFLLAQGPQAWSNAKSLLGLDVWDWWQADPVTAPERAKELADKGLREQLISFEDGMESIEYRYGGRPDTQQYVIYAIGVGQITLGKPEPNEDVEKITVTGSRLQDPAKMPDANSMPTSPINGRFNNVLIFDRRVGKFTKLFDKRIAISEFQYGWRTTPEALIVFACDRDTDGDGKLSGADMQDIYIYAFADKRMHKIEAQGLNPLEVMPIPDVDYVVVKARRDRNNDGRTTSGDPYARGERQEPEPVVLLRIDLKTMKASSFIPDDMIENLQRTLDGTVPPPAPEKK
jgi:hypothetical protein